MPCTWPTLLRQVECADAAASARRLKTGAASRISINERKLYEVDGVRYCHVTQVGKIEEVWEEFGKHCEQVRKLDRPCVNFDFVSAAGQPLGVNEAERDDVIQRGYRGLIGGLLWPARNSTPGIQTAVSRLCRCMQQPSYKAWTAALQVLQWLYHNREEGITFRSDGNQQLRCYYDSGHCWPIAEKFLLRSTGG